MSKIYVNEIYNLSGAMPAISVPAFRVHTETSQNVTSNVETKAVLDIKDFDTNNWFDTSTYRYTPQIAGYYSFTGMLRIAGTTLTSQSASLFKNGSRIFSSFNRVSSSTPVHVVVTDLIYLNGSTDYVELYGISSGASGTSFNYADNSATSILSGFLVRTA
jgi:hypothetical protein